MRMIGTSVAVSLLSACALVGATGASAQITMRDREMATASMMRTCLADATPKASDLKLSAEGVQDYCRCFAAKIGGGIPLAQLKGPATPKSMRWPALPGRNATWRCPTA